MRTFVEQLLALAYVSDGYADSQGRFLLWCCMIYCLTEHSGFENCIDNCHFVSHELLTYHSAFGLVIFTSKGVYAYANLCLPSRPENTEALVLGFVEELQHTYVLNLASIHRSLRSVAASSPRFNTESLAVSASIFFREATV